MSPSPEERHLEALVARAAGEPALRPQMCAAVLESTGYVLLTGAVQLVGGGADVELQHWYTAEGEAVIPFFTSLVQVQRAVGTPTRYVGMEGRALLEATRGATLCLNPGTRPQAGFRPVLVEKLLAG